MGQFGLKVTSSIEQNIRVKLEYNSHVRVEWVQEIGQGKIRWIEGQLLGQATESARLTLEVEAEATHFLWATVLAPMIDPN